MFWGFKKKWYDEWLWIFFDRQSLWTICVWYVFHGVLGPAKDKIYWRHSWNFKYMSSYTEPIVYTLTRDA